uniref:Uncharacterized protein n=3 Tax=Oryza sativa subsp. japonica TaxID=39947 RepID=Q53KT4_ORYSJ|nr:hypothetical protein [Oryza sativa Japonica Group]
MRRISGDLPPAATAHDGAGASGAAWPPWPSSGVQGDRAEPRLANSRVEDATDARAHRGMASRRNAASRWGGGKEAEDADGGERAAVRQQVLEFQQHPALIQGSSSSRGVPSHGSRSQLRRLRLQPVMMKHAHKVFDEMYSRKRQIRMEFLGGLAWG